MKGQDWSGTVSVRKVGVRLDEAPITIGVTSGLKEDRCKPHEARITWYASHVEVSLVGIGILKSGRVANYWRTVKVELGRQGKPWYPLAPDWVRDLVATVEGRGPGDA